MVNPSRRGGGGGRSGAGPRGTAISRLPSNTPRCLGPSAGHTGTSEPVLSALTEPTVTLPGRCQQTLPIPPWPWLTAGCRGGRGEGTRDSWGT